MWVGLAMYFLKTFTTNCTLSTINCTTDDQTPPTNFGPVAIAEKYASAWFTALRFSFPLHPYVVVCFDRLKRKQRKTALIFNIFLCFLPFSLFCALTVHEQDWHFILSDLHLFFCQLFSFRKYNTEYISKYRESLQIISTFNKLDLINW